MELIRKLDRRKSKTGNNISSWGLFWCSFCETEVERQLGSGKRDKSCGCHKNVTHGDYKTRLYRIWKAMKNRCLNPNNKRYNDYGGRGITVCTEWTDKDNGFINFRYWAIQNGYKEELQIDRIDNNGNYSSDNCRWVTHQENSQNKRTTKLTLEKVNEIRELYKTGDYLQRELAEKYNVTQDIISRIINKKRWGK